MGADVVLDHPELLLQRVALCDVLLVRLLLLCALGVLLRLFLAGGKLLAELAQLLLVLPDAGLNRRLLCLQLHPMQLKVGDPGFHVYGRVQLLEQPFLLGLESGEPASQ